MARRKRYPQVIIIELVLVAAVAVAVYFLVAKTGAPHALGLFLAGGVADRLLVIVGRKPQRRSRSRSRSVPGLPVVSKATARKPAARRPAARRPAARRPAARRSS